jgi:hypothetical protein
VTVWYECLFFNVRDRLNNFGYLMHHAIGPRVHTALNENDVELIWKLVALVGGSNLLNNVIQIMTPIVLDDPANARKYHNNQTRDLVGHRALLAAVTLRTRDAMNKLQMMELNAKYFEIESKVDGSVGSTEDYALDGLKQVLASIPISANHVNSGQLPANVLPNGVEVRAADMLKLQLGIPVDLPDGTTPFPEPRRFGAAEPAEQEPDDVNKPEKF